MSKKSSNRDKSPKNNGKSRKQSSGFVFKIVFFIASVAVGLSSYYFYHLFANREPPQINLNQWWGPWPADRKVDTSIRPFQIEFSDVMVNDLRERLLHQRPFVEPLENTAFTYGVNTRFLAQVLNYWKNKYDFKEREAYFNKYEHFKTKIQGLDMHFMRVKPKDADGMKVLPLLMLHGWPGSIREFYEIIPLLTTPRPKYNFVFEVIVPSLPGYGFSDAAVRPGLAVTEIAVIMHNLMKRIGFNQYYVQGGDWGHAIGSAMATLFQDNVLGFHTNAPVLLHRLDPLISIVGSLWPSLILEEQLIDNKYPLSNSNAFLIEESGYMHLQATKPDTIGVALTDSPAGLAAYILEKFSTWTNKEFRKMGDGNLLTKFSLTHLLDNIMVYWATNSITTSMRLYAESMTSRHMGLWMDEIPTKVPTAGIKFKNEILTSPDIVLKLKFKNYLQTSVVMDGGHFAAFEMPAILADDIFGATVKFLQFHAEKNKDTAENIQQKTESKTKPTTIYDFTVKDIHGKDVKLDRYKGHVTIIVNVASLCGLTDTNYQQLNHLYEKYSQSKGLRILAFPCNQFGGQEPGNTNDIIKFITERGVKFDVFEKIEVNGPNTHPLWTFLKETQRGTMGDFIKWNFSKFIIDRNGVPVERLAPNVNPIDMEPLLAKYW